MRSFHCQESGNKPSWPSLSSKLFKRSSHCGVVWGGQTVIPKAEESRSPDRVSQPKYVWPILFHKIGGAINSNYVNNKTAVQKAPRLAC